MQVTLDKPQGVHPHSRVKITENTQKIESALNDLDTRLSNIKTEYDLAETVIGTWMGQTLYRKIINFGALPNNTDKPIPHGITNLLYVVKNNGFAYRPTAPVSMKLPYVDPAGISAAVSLYVSGNNIVIGARADRSAWDTCYVTLEYVKTA